MMTAETLNVVPSTDEQTWRHLWSHATYQIISALPTTDGYETVAIGNGWGLRSTTDPRRALVIHRPASGHAIGELALTVHGSPTHVIPRCGRGYVEYLDAVADIVQTTANVFLQD
jgi:hypothetical protein